MRARDLSWPQSGCGRVECGVFVCWPAMVGWWASKRVTYLVVNVLSLTSLACRPQCRWPSPALVFALSLSLSLSPRANQRQPLHPDLSDS